MRRPLEVIKLFSMISPYLVLEMFARGRDFFGGGGVRPSEMMLVQQLKGGREV